MGLRRRRRASRGFTLVEMVVVMAVLGILSVGAVLFLTDATNGYASVQDREQLAMRGRHTIEQMSRGIRNALPGSLRVNGPCMEYIPIRHGAYYLDLPVSTIANQFKSIPPSVGGLDGTRIAVAPTAAAYNLSILSEISPPVVVSAIDPSQEVTVTFAQAHQFPRESSGNRFFWVDEPVSYCLDSSDLWRYVDYGYRILQPTPASLPTTLPGRSLAAESAQVKFAVSAPTLQRNAVVEVALTLLEGATRFDATARIQVQNVP